LSILSDLKPLWFPEPPLRLALALSSSRMPPSKAITSEHETSQLRALPHVVLFVVLITGLLPTFLVLAQQNTELRGPGKCIAHANIDPVAANR
jgi:hypothetical protein